jgi:hypothetical protein
MGSRNPERDRFLASDYVHIIDWHRQSPGWAILVSCTGCAHSTYAHSFEVLRMRNPPDTIGQWKARLVCKCGSREVNLHPRFVGERR